MPEPDYGGLQEPENQGLASAVEAIKKIGVGKIVLAIVILAALAWFFVLSPKPGTLVVTVEEIDSKTVLEGTLVELSIPGQKSRTLFIDERGFVEFKDVPSKIELTLHVEPPSTHKATTDSLTLESGEKRSIELKASRNANLVVRAETRELSLGAGCSTTIPLQVRNDGTEAFLVNLIGEGSLQGLVTADNKTVLPNSNEVVSLRITAPKETGSLSGGIRAQYTKASESLTLIVGERTEADVRPSSITAGVTPGQQLKQLITVKNIAREGELRDLDVQITGEIAQYTQTPEFTDKRPLRPDEEKILTLVIDVPSSGEKKLVGVLVISTSCRSYQVPIELEVQSSE